MDAINKHLDTFRVIGIAIRTTNKDAQSEKDISELWQRFIHEKIIDRIPDKINTDIYCIYTDYEGDHNGLYTTIIGCKVASTENLPEAFISKTIPATTYRVYASTGKLPDCVVKTWLTIWHSGLHRNYIADFDVYGEKAKNPENAEIETYVS